MLDSRKYFRDDIAYILPMGAFLAFTWVGATYKETFPWVYISKTIIAAILLVWLWNRFTKVRWTHLHWGVIVGVIGIVQWVGMEKLLMHFPALSWTRMTADISKDAFRPFDYFTTPAAAWSWIILRWAGASLVVPVMEELFWRDYLWRTISSPNDFKLEPVGTYDKSAFWIVPLIFATVHVQWLTAIVWALMIALLLVRTKSIGACMVAHSVTNFLLGAYVLWTKDWGFW